MLLPRRIRFCILTSLALFAICATSTSTSAQMSLNRYSRLVFPICIERPPIFEIPPIKIPVGCEVIDCCPGCPGGPIDWRVRVEGPIQQANIRFENLSARLTPQNVRGTGKLERNVLAANRGESFVSGLARTGMKGRPPVAQVEVMFDSAGIQSKRDGGARSGAPDADASIIIEQLVRGIVVYEKIFTYRIWRCGRPTPTPASDQIDLDNNEGNDNAVILMDARRSSGCVNDEVQRGFNLINVLSVLSNGGCRSEAVVFSDDDAVQLIENVLNWTDPLGDLLPANLTPNRWQLPVDVWVVDSTLIARSQNEMAQADLLLNTNHAGIDVLAAAVYRPVVNAANATTINTTTQNVWNAGACNVGAITGNAAIFTAGRINVYFVNGAFTGWWCPGTNVIAIGTNAQPESLVHEFGHAFSLGHTNNVDFDGNGTNDFPNTNIMWGGGVGRTTFTEGQDFRMTLNPGSRLNANGVRNVGPTRNCGDATISAACPWSALDVIPN